MNWIFKKDENFSMDSNNQKAVVTFSQKRNFTGEEGENVLILEKKKGEWEFTDQYCISSIGIKNPEAEYKEITITLFIVKHFEDEKLLEDYVYSLSRVTNFAYPIKHFSRKYSRLHDAEFEAIVEDKIYQKRTILGTVLNAMHSDHQRAFVAYAGIEAPELLTGKIDMDIALKLLLSYLEFAVVKPAEYLRESGKMLQSVISEDEYAQTGFGFDEEKLNSRNTQMIKPQVAAIDEHLEDLFEYTNEKLGLQLLQLQDNPKFRTLFRNTPLPLTLN
jgi:hypothetical protein